MHDASSHDYDYIAVVLVQSCKECDRVMKTVPMTSKEMRVVELNAQYLGVTLSMLMQQAGREVARIVMMNEDVEAKKIVILCGGGGNGGDGMVAARHLSEGGAAVQVYLVGSEKHISNPDTVINWHILNNLWSVHNTTLRSEAAVHSCDSIADADILIDGLMGFGLKSTLREPILSAVNAINESSAQKYSIDVPTGINSDTGEVLGAAVKADATVTLHAPKPGLLTAKDYVGDLYVVPIGIPPEAEYTAGPGDLWLFNRPRKTTAHKGDFGRILIIGGSDVFSGAPSLAGLAALRTGADLVSVVAPDPVVPAIRSYSPNLMVRSLGERILTEASVKYILEIARKMSVIAIGPGLGLADETVTAVNQIVESLVKLKKPMVIDADGLKALAGSDLRLDPTTCVLTPHWGELTILLKSKIEHTDNTDKRIESASQAAKKYNSVVLLKSAIDIIIHPEGMYKLNRTGSPAMTVGGTGDVLTGITAALLARGEGAFHAAAAAAFISGLAGEHAVDDFGEHILATDCISKIPEVMRP